MPKFELERTIKNLVRDIAIFKKQYGLELKFDRDIQDELHQMQGDLYTYAAQYMAAA